MSAETIKALAQQFADAFDKKDLRAVIEMLAEDVEIFDHVPYRFDNKAQFAKYLNEAIAGVGAMSFAFRQPSCRIYNDNMGIVNTYDTFMGMTKDGKPLTIHGRTTLVFAKQGGQWKIVSCHFSSLPHTP